MLVPHDDTRQIESVKLKWGITIFSLFFLAAAVCVYIFLPVDKSVSSVPFNVSFAKTADAEADDTGDDIEFDDPVDSYKKKTNSKSRDDVGLALYRQPHSRAAVEWFYTHITENRDVSMAILKYAEKYDIPISLAFALAYTESHYNTKAQHQNVNSSIDRGLFQLNSQSFPRLKESDFFDPDTSAKYGMSHLRYCLNIAGNEVAALAMYNAGANKVRSNNTPQVTLNYVSNIMTYRNNLDSMFSGEVVAFYENEPDTLLAQK